MDPKRAAKILLVDDDDGLLGLLSFLVQRAEFRPIVATSADTALELLDEQAPDLVLLDVRLGDDDGLELLDTIRRSTNVPVIMVSSLDSEEDIERALDRGADDYVTKPFAFRELVARIRAMLRRTCAPGPIAPDDDWMHVGPLALNPSEHKATLDGLPLALTSTEFRLLRLLMEHTDKVVPYSVLLERVWGYADPTATDIVRAAVYRLRQKLAETNEHPVIRTLPSVGLVLQSSPEKTEPMLLHDEPARANWALDAA